MPHAEGQVGANRERHTRQAVDFLVTLQHTRRPAAKNVARREGSVRATDGSM
jgi:hypothetical protein